MNRWANESPPPVHGRDKSETTQPRRAPGKRPTVGRPGPRHGTRQGSAPEAADDNAKRPPQRHGLGHGPLDSGRPFMNSHGRKPVVRSTRSLFCVLVFKPRQGRLDAEPPIAPDGALKQNGQRKDGSAAPRATGARGYSQPPLPGRRAAWQPPLPGRGRRDGAVRAGATSAAAFAWSTRSPVMGLEPFFAAAVRSLRPFAPIRRQRPPGSGRGQRPSGAPPAGRRRGRG